jgi:RimJ/RimL family protein N-acetyltransferase
MLELEIRLVEFSDASTLMQWENESENLLHSNRTKPYDFQEILDLIDCSKDFEHSYQLRFIIQYGAVSIGILDFFNFQSAEKSMEIGILISVKEYRRLGLASKALQSGFIEMKKYGVENFTAKVESSNLESQGLFEKNYFLKEKPIKKECTFDSKNNIIVYHRCVNL